MHSVLVDAKSDRLESIEQYLARDYFRFEELLTAGGDTHIVATELNALSTIRQEIGRTRTWPFNTELLRTLVISVVTPNRHWPIEINPTIALRQSVLKPCFTELTLGIVAKIWITRSPTWGC